MSGYTTEKKEFNKILDLKAVKPYGDTMNDGKVQVSFTLPIPDDPKASETAKRVIRKMNLANPQIVYQKKLTDSFTFFVGYGEFVASINYEEIEVQTINIKKMDMKEIDNFISEEIGRKLVVIGASTGTDAHTVGIDAIMNMKGFAGHYGLERYKMFDAYNLGSQVSNEDLIEKAIDLNADAILISQTVTAKNVHINNMIQLVELLEAEGIRENIILVAGGARITHELSKELGYDAGFGPGSFAEDVASYIAHEFIERSLK